MAQADVQISISGWDNELTISSLSLQQSYKHHHTFELLAFVPVDFKLSIETLKSILGEQISIRITTEDQKGSTCNFNGFISEVVPVWAGRNTVLKVKGFSPSYLMDAMPRFRSFNEKSIGQILNKIMRDYTGKQGPKLAAITIGEQVPFSVQTQETDYHYLCRLADNYGKQFFYDGQQMCFGNLNEVDKNRITLDAKKDITHAELSLNTLPLHFKLNGYNPENSESIHYNASQAVTNNNAIASSVINKSSCYSDQSIHVNYGIAGQEDLKTEAKKIAAQQAQDLVTLHGESNHPGLKIGSSITIKNGPELLSQGSYIITEVNHFIHNDTAYYNSFQAIPSGYAFPAKMQHRNKQVSGPLMAIVKENNDPKNQGRVRVEFIGDKEKGLSPWLRVVVPYTKHGGFYFLPEKEDQVLIFGEDFNIEKSPFVIGSFFHGNAKADQWKDSNNKKKGIALEKISFLFDDNTGKLTIEANEIELKARKEMTLEGGNQLTQKASRIDLNP